VSTKNVIPRNSNGSLRVHAGLLSGGIISFNLRIFYYLAIFLFLFFLFFVFSTFSIFSDDSCDQGVIVNKLWASIANQIIAIPICQCVLQIYRNPHLFVTFTFLLFPRRVLHPVLSISWLRQLCSDESHDFYNKSEEMCQFYNKLCYNIMTWLSTQLNTVLNRLIERRKRTREFHLRSLKDNASFCYCAFVLRILGLVCVSRNQETTISDETPETRRNEWELWPWKPALTTTNLPPSPPYQCCFATKIPLMKPQSF